MTSTRNDAFPTDIDSLARRRARAKMGWYTHAAIYLLVNAGLALLSLRSGGHGALFPALGWGIGLLAHGLSVFLSGAGAQFHDGLVRRERERLMAQRTAH